MYKLACRLADTKAVGISGDLSTSTERSACWRKNCRAFGHSCLDRTPPECAHSKASLHFATSQARRDVASGLAIESY